MKIDACGATHTGNLRSHNEDNLYVDGVFRRNVQQNNVLIRSRRESGPYVYAVFDGLGGEACGEQASLIAALGLKGMEQRGVVRDIEHFVSTANKAIMKEAVRKEVRTMGTTAVIAVIEGSEARVYNIGDSRAYLLRNGKLSRVSRDHTVLQSLVDNGFTEEAERQKKRYAGELTQYIGMTSEEDIEPSAFEAFVTLEPGDMMLLCSDGLTGELSDDEIRDIMTSDSGRSAEYLTARLIKGAVDKAGSDNITAIVCKVI